MSSWRLTAVLILVATTAAIARTGSETVAAPPALLNVPYTLGAWNGSDAGPAAGEADLVVVADQIINRSYATPDGEATGLYVAYYARQRPGVSIHSPLHCLPGTGWDVLTNEIVPVSLTTGQTGAVRRLVARRDASRIVVLYWYEIHGRMIASDLLSRVQLLGDRIRLGRNDATLVRLVMPVTDSEIAAEQRGLTFMNALVPYL